MKQIIQTNNAPQAIGPYSQAIEVNGMIYTSGQLPIDYKTGLMSEDVEKQAEQSLKNVVAILKEAGVELSNVIKTTVFIKDMNEFYGEYQAGAEVGSRAPLVNYTTGDVEPSEVFDGRGE